MRLRYLFVFPLLAGLLFVGHALHAQQPPLSLAISPPTFELSANPGDTKTNSLRVDNLTDEPQHITVGRRNFTALGEEGQPNLTEDETAFALASWLRVTPETVIIPPRASQVFEFVITVPANAEPGGHFGSIIFKTDAKPVTGQSGVAVGQEIGSLILLKVAGQINEQASIESFKPAKNFWEYGPVTFETRLKNAGNVHVKPVGTITITNMFGRKVATLPLESRNVLPSSIRKFSTNWPQKWLWGRYTATLSVAYGGKDQIVTASTNFWSFPVRWAAITLLLLTGLGVLLYKHKDRLKRAAKILLGRD